jgi:hypothetical protein
MHLIAVPDIFGKTEEFERLISRVSTRFQGVELLDPYSGKSPSFANEQDAYLYFQKHVGLEKYAGIVLDSVLYREEEFLLLGFSVGASAIWQISGNNIFHKNSKAMCFYGSQIRFFLDIQPALTMALFFPLKETTFNVFELMAKVSVRDNVQCFHTRFLHGFMNERSMNFDTIGCAEYIKKIK